MGSPLLMLKVCSAGSMLSGGRAVSVTGQIRSACSASGKLLASCEIWFLSRSNVPELSSLLLQTLVKLVPE